MSSTRYAALTAVMLLAHTVAGDNTTTPVSTYLSRPDIQAPALNCMTSNSDPATGFTPGYIFVAPWEVTQPGPYIYDKFCNLVWSGVGVSSGNAHDFKVCSYGGSDHLCMFQGTQEPGYGRGHGVILDNTYSVVHSVQTGNGILPNDMHEFNTIGDGSIALVTSYNVKLYDLSNYGITSGQGWLMEGVFQEIDTATGAVNFQWNSADVVDPSDGYVAPNTTNVVENGLTAETAWDYFHINSIDKSTYSNLYLVSARHTSTIYLINNTDGSIVWRLSAGGESDFVCQDFSFAFQHHARFAYENDTHTLLTLFDNASDGYNKTESQSAGLYIVLDLNAKTASLIRRTYAPYDGGVSSDSQGNTQLLSNGYTFHGWGSEACVSEHDTSGNAVLLATFGEDPVASYRAYTFPWNASPVSGPSLYAFARYTSGPMTVAASWNGATEVQAYNFYGGDSQWGPWTWLAYVNQTGFETMYTASLYQAYVYAEAVGYFGESLANSTALKTFVPGDELAGSCDDVQCPTTWYYNGQAHRHKKSSAEGRARGTLKAVGGWFGFWIAAWTLW